MSEVHPGLRVLREHIPNTLARRKLVMALCTVAVPSVSGELTYANTCEVLRLRGYHYLLKEEVETIHAFIESI